MLRKVQRHGFVFAMIIIFVSLIWIFITFRSVTHSLNEIQERLKFTSNEISDKKTDGHQTNPTFTCIEGIGAVDHCIRKINVNRLAAMARPYACVDLQVSDNMTICIHNPENDIYLSKSILNSGTFERDLVDNFEMSLEKHGITDFLDVGCNIGVYTLTAAKLHKRVVSIDANIENLKLLSKSIVLGGFEKNVALIWNAVYDVYTNVSLFINQRSIACSFIKDNVKSERATEVETMLLDDLQDMLKGKTVAIKMDIEQAELHAIRGATSFLRNINIRFIQMEITHHPSQSTRPVIVSTLQGYGFIPYKTCLGNDNLSTVPLTKWPIDVCFIR